MIAVIETDKVNVDIRSTHTGKIVQFFAGEGDEVQVNGDFFEIDTDAKGGDAPSKPAKTETPKKESTPPPPAPPKQAAPPSPPPV